MRRKFIIFLCSLVIVAGCVSGCKGNDSSVPEPTAESSSQKEEDYIPYKSLAGNYEIKLPSEWVQTTEGNNMTVTERNTGTYISVIIRRIIFFRCSKVKERLCKVMPRKQAITSSWLYPTPQIICL